MKKQVINIMGAGLCGSLFSIMLAKQGFSVIVRERRSNPNSNIGAKEAGKSINLAMSVRGINALKYAGIFKEVEPLLIPMKGRMLHYQDGRNELQSYGQHKNEFIYSISRSRLNHMLVDAAENCGVDVKFEHTIVSYDEQQTIGIKSPEGKYKLKAEKIILADGSSSLIRRSYNDNDPIFPKEYILPHSYKELSIPANENGSFKIEKNALHVWPRGQFMLIALPNPEGDFTLTLFMPTEGEKSFSALEKEKDIEEFFSEYFSDALPLIPDLTSQFTNNPTGSLRTIRCKHWHDKDNFLLIGDAAHAMVPFHAQGMNSAFDDCVLLDTIIKNNNDWHDIYQKFEETQLPNAHAIQDMALENYIEMRDGVLDKKFSLKKELSFALEKHLPSYFIPRYSMVMFHGEIPYSVSQERGEIQKEILDELTRNRDNLNQIDFNQAEKIIKQKLTPL